MEKFLSSKTEDYPSTPSDSEDEGEDSWDQVKEYSSSSYDINSGRHLK